VRLVSLQRIGIDILQRKVQTTTVKKLIPKDTTVLIYASGYIKSAIAMSFETNVLTKLAEDFIDCKGLSPEEQIEINQSVASEVTNIIVGRSFISLNKKDITTITPPKLLITKEDISEFENLEITITTFKTSFGEIQVYVKK